MKLIDYTSNKLVFTDINAGSAGDLFAYVSEILCIHKIIPDKKDAETVKRDFMEREKINSTGLGNGIAVPHISLQALEKPVILICRTIKSIDFNALDSMPVSLFFFILGRRNHVSEHLNMLSRLSFLLRDKDFTTELKKLKIKKSIWELFMTKDLNTP